MCKFSVSLMYLHLKSVSLMQTYIKLTPHFLEIFEKSFYLKKNLEFIQKILVFSFKKHVYSAKILIYF